AHAPSAAGEPGHARHGHAYAADFAAQEIEHLDKAGGAVYRVGDAERDAGLDDGVIAHPHLKRVHIDHVADEYDIGLLDEIAKSNGEIRGRLDRNGGKPDPKGTREPKTHPVR